MKDKFTYEPKIKGIGVSHYKHKTTGETIYYVYFSIKDNPEDKYRKGKFGYFKDELTAQIKMNEFLINNQNINFKIPEDFKNSLKVYSTDFAKSLDRKRRDTTIQHKMGILDKYILKDFGFWTADEFIHSKKEWDKLYYRIINSNLTSEYINHILRVIREFISHLENVGAIKTQDAVRFRYKFSGISNDKRKSKKDTLFYSFEELLNWVKKIGDKYNDEFYVFLLFQLYCTLRIGEAIGLQRKHIKNDFTEIVIEQQVQWIRKEHKSIITAPKTANAYRVLKLPIIVSKALKEYCEVNNINDPEQFVFFGGKKPTGASSFARMFKHYSEEFNMPFRVENHMFRRAMTTYFFSLPNLSVAQMASFGARMGHDDSTIATLIKNYLNKSKRDDAEIIDLIENKGE